MKTRTLLCGALFFIFGFLLTVKAQASDLPKHVKVENGVFTVKLSKDHWSKDKPLGETCDRAAIRMGLCAEDAFGTMTIARGQPLPEERISFFHEFIHATLGNDKNNEQIPCRSFLEELAPKLFAALRDNPEVLEYLRRSHHERPLQKQHFSQSALREAPIPEEDLKSSFDTLLQSLFSPGALKVEANYHTIIKRLSPVLLRSLDSRPEYLKQLASLSRN